MTPVSCYGVCVEEEVILRAAAKFPKLPKLASLACSTSSPSLHYLPHVTVGVLLLTLPIRSSHECTMKPVAVTLIISQNSDNTDQRVPIWLTSSRRMVPNHHASLLLVLCEFCGYCKFGDVLDHLVYSVIDTPRARGISDYFQTISHSYYVTFLDFSCVSFATCSPVGCYTY